MKKKILLIGVVFASIFATAQEVDTTTAPTPAPTTVAGIKVEGYVDTYYQSNFGYNKGKGTKKNGDVLNNGLSPYSDSFELGNVNLKLSKDLGKVGFVAQVGFGSRAEFANYNALGQNSNTAIIVQQAYVYYKPFSKVTLTAGNFSTHVGYEVIDAPKNFHYSVSNLFQNGPFYHQGVKADFDLGKGFGLMVGAFNQTDIKSNAQAGSNALNGGAQLKYNSGNFNAYLNYVGGLSAATALVPVRNQIDFVADYKVDKVYLAFNPTYVTFNPRVGDPTEWFGGALYAQYAVNDMVSLGFRTEYIDNADSIGLTTGVGNLSGVADKSMWSHTISAPLTLAPGFRLVPEFRLDTAQNNIYRNNKGTLQDKQYTLGLAAMYSF
ncbi:MAG: porin [Solirubrobacteraceae bacterium]